MPPNSVELSGVVRRIIDAIPTARTCVLVRDRCGRAELVDAVLAELHRRGLETVVERVSNAQLREVIANRSVVELAAWDTERAADTERVEALITLGGWPADLAGLPAASVAAWAQAVGRVEAVLESRRISTVAVAVPSPSIADSLGISSAELDRRVFAAITVPAGDLRAHTAPVVSTLESADTFELLTAGGAARLRRAGRPLLVDDGVVDGDDIALGAIVSNLPAGSVYWTVLEDATRGTIVLDDGSVLVFDDHGRVTAGPYAGERIGHIGLATNPRVTDTIGWTIVDEHRAGAVFVSLGENRYMGGSNASDINVDLLPSQPIIRVGPIDVTVT